ncbi:MAG: formate--phosphoribosylaminoimidazolecarboxamide ligase family protein [Nitrososphaerales archaeon]
MINQNTINAIIKSYKLENISIGTLGSHSALDIADGAKDEGLRTVVVCQEGREKPYLFYKRIVDEAIVLKRFSDIMKPEVQKHLRDRNTIFVPHRAFTTYVDYDSIEKAFEVPIFGNRWILRAEERTAPVNQYHILENAGIRFPRVFKSFEEIDRPVIVKVHEARRKIERAFFVATSPKDYLEKVKERIEKGIISEDDLASAKIEEFVIGTYFNFNYFHSPISKRVEFLGIDRRLQTDLFDYVTLPAKQQLEINIPLQNIEIGHTPATIRESMLEKVLTIGEKFVEATKHLFPPGIIGPFALQSAVTKDLDIVVYDVSPRVPGSPIISTTSPYSKYLFGQSVSTGRRIAIEVKNAIKAGRLGDVVT